MKYINLVNVSKGTIGYKRVQYPDNQQDIIINEEVTDNPGPVTIKSRFSKWSDYEIIACTVSALRRLNYKEIHLYCPYLMGGRSDRDFSRGKGGTSYLLDVVKPAIDLLGFQTITVIDPHSDVMGAILNLRPKDNLELVAWSLLDMNIKDICIVSPDAGASKKIYDLLKDGGIETELIIAGKHRDVTTGSLLGFDVPVLPGQVNKPLVWIDDICDGGGTFIGEAKEADKNGHLGDKYLIITHGIFSQGFAALTKYFDGIYSTNSYSSFGDIAGNNEERTLLKQMDIF